MPYGYKHAIGAFFALSMIASTGSWAHGYSNENGRTNVPDSTRQALQAKRNRPAAQYNRRPQQAQRRAAPRYIPPQGQTLYPANKFTNSREIPRSFIVIPQTPNRGHRRGNGRNHRQY